MPRRLDQNVPTRPVEPGQYDDPASRGQISQSLAPRTVDFDLGSAAPLARLPQVLRAVLAAQPWRPHPPDENELRVAGSTFRVKQRDDLAGAEWVGHFSALAREEALPDRKFTAASARY